MNGFLDDASPNEIVRAFAANPAFRAAEWHELTTEDNPYRRPVRPGDLAWLDYSVPMARRDALKLTGLLGHRMLRNVYDLDSLYLPPAPSEAAAADHDAYYCDRNRSLTALAKPILEAHLFGYLDTDRTPLDRPDVDTARRHVLDHLRRRREEPGTVFDAVTATRRRRAAATFLLVQLSAHLPAANTAVGRAALGEYDPAHPRLRGRLLDAYQAWVTNGERYASLLAGAELTPGAAAYWQLYLGSSLARGNHLHFLAVNRERAAAFLGAFVHKTIDELVTAPRYAAVLAECLDADTSYFDGYLAGGDVSETAVGELVDELLSPLAQRYGERAVTEFHEGFADSAELARLWDADARAQIMWADRIEDYQDKADKIQHHLADENIEVDLDTFVESSAETSTTHVHDDHRLVMVESGQMHFWHDTTHKIELNAGDKLLVPMSRLHGSTVLSGECTYHQPIIPDDIFQKFD